MLFLARDFGRQACQCLYCTCHVSSLSNIVPRSGYGICPRYLANPDELCIRHVEQNVSGTRTSIILRPCDDSDSRKGRLQMKSGPSHLRPLSRLVDAGAQRSIRDSNNIDTV